LAFVDTDQAYNPFISPIEEPAPEQQKEEEPAMSRPSNASNAVLNPVIAMIRVNDPEYASYDLTHERCVVGTRTDIPAGVDPTNFCSRVLMCGTKIEFIGVTVQSSFDASFTLGKRLVDSPDGDLIVAAFENTLTKDWTATATCTHGKASTPAEVRSWVVNLPVKVERRPLNPHAGWKPCPPGMQGFVNVVADARSSFFYTFNLVEEDPNLINPLTSMGGLMDVTYQQESNPMGVVEMQRSRMQNLNLFASATASGATGGRTIPATVGGGGGGGGGGGRSHRSRMSIDSQLDTSSSSSSSSSSFKGPPGHPPTGLTRAQIVRRERERDRERRQTETEDRDNELLLAQARYKRAREAERLAADIASRAQEETKYGYTASASVSKATGTATATKPKRKNLFKTSANVSPSDYLNRNSKYDTRNPIVTTVGSDDSYEEHTVTGGSSSRGSRSGR
jgi:hypothetical protein